MGDNRKLTISFSQYSKYLKCPRHYKLDYIDGLKTFEDSINTAFGTAIHEPIQLYVKTLYTEGSVAADSIDITKMFSTRFNELLFDEKKKIKSTESEYTEFYHQGVDILNEFLQNRRKHFPSDEYEFLGTEFPLEFELSNNTKFVGYIDLLLKNKKNGRIKIIDFKTSSVGWNSSTKEDIKKTHQLLLYKSVYSKISGVPVHMIDVVFFIFKRKLYENVRFPQSKLQVYIPESNKTEMSNMMGSFASFVKHCFTSSGQYNVNADYPKDPGIGKKNCKYCNHKGIRCDGKFDKPTKL